MTWLKVDWGNYEIDVICAQLLEKTWKYLMIPTYKQWNWPFVEKFECKIVNRDLKSTRIWICKCEVYQLTPPIPRTASVALLMIPTAVAIVSLTYKYFRSNQHKYFLNMYSFIFLLQLMCCRFSCYSSSLETESQQLDNRVRGWTSHELTSRL